MKPVVPVRLLRRPDYAEPALSDHIAGLLEAAGLRPSKGERILVKPNLVSAMQGPLACSEPAVVRAACTYLLDHGADIAVADSTAFGTASVVAKQIGLAEALAPLGLATRGLGRPQTLTLSFGAGVGLSRDALAADRILNIPRVKVHCQCVMSLCVKNLFGCVVGMRKAVAHSRFGEQGNRFERMLIEVMEALPPTVNLLDGVRAMHVEGPTGGEPYPLGLLGACDNAVALDTAVYALLGLSPQQVPLWRESRESGLHGSRVSELRFPLLSPQNFTTDGFVFAPAKPVSFHPYRLARGALKRLVLKAKGK